MVRGPAVRSCTSLLFLTILMALAMSAGATVSAQTVTGSAQGTATDTSGAVLPGVNIVLKNTETGQVRELTTNEAGFYSAPFLPLGVYQVTASLSGFGTIIREKVDVTLNATRVIDFQLNPSMTETVSVIAEPPPINTTNQEIKSSLSSEQIMDKPTLNPGSFLSLAETFTGFMENPTSGQNNPTLSSGTSVNFGGVGTRSTTFQINGVNNDDSSENQNRQGVPVATIQEFQVIQSTYGAEFGRSAGSVVLVQTKSGTNKFKGEVYEYNRDSDYSAKATFDQVKPSNYRHQYGGVLGFPIKKDLLFGFVSVDRTIFKGEQSYTRDVFTDEELSRPRLTRGNDTPANRAFIESVLARFPATARPNDPRSPRTYAGAVVVDQPAEDYSGRVDWNLARNHTITGRYQYSHQKFDNTDVVIGEQAFQNNTQSNVGITWTQILTPGILGEFRYGLGLRSTNVDIEAGNDTPVIRFAGSPVSGSTIGNAGAFPINRDQRDHQFVYNLTSQVGNTHSFKVGTDIRLSNLDDLADNFSRGFWSFAAACGGVTYPTSYAAFLDGCVATYTKGYGEFFLENRLREYNFYAEDAWRPTKNLTLNLGIRYEYVRKPHEAQNRIEYAYNDDKDNIEPRVGFAYAPGWNTGVLGWLTGGADNASIRGGYGLYHDRLFQSVFSQGGAGIRFNPPNAASIVFSTQPNILNVSDPTNGFVFTPGTPTTRVTLAVPDPDLHLPYTHQWNLTLERKIPFNSSVRLTYNGSRGIDFVRYAQGNLPVSPLDGGIRVVDHPNNAPAAGFPDLRGVLIDRVADDVLCAGTGFLPNLPVNAACPNVVPIANNEISFRVPRTNERRPDPRYTTNLVISNDAEKWYHGLQMEWIKRVSKGVRFEAAYTWSKAMDTTSEATALNAGDTNQTGPNRRFARGLSRFHTPHRFTLNGSWQLPFFQDRRDVLGATLGGWQLTGVIRLAAGTPFTVIDTGGRDLNFDGFTENRPIILDPSILGHSVDHPAVSRDQLPRSAFRNAIYGEFTGDIVGRNTFFVDGTNTVDLGVYKNFIVPRYGHRINVRIEMYNAFNSVQYGFPSLDFAATNFGAIVGTATAYRPRAVQLAARYSF